MKREGGLLTCARELSLTWVFNFTRASLEKVHRLIKTFRGYVVKLTRAPSLTSVAVKVNSFIVILKREREEICL
jgi:hypothetical protein